MINQNSKLIGQHMMQLCLHAKTGTIHTVYPQGNW